MAEFEHQRPNLQIAVFAEFKVHDRLLAVAIDESQRTRIAVARTPSVLVAGENLALHARDLRFAQAAVECDVVALRNLVARMTQSICELPIVGEDEKSGRIKVEPPDAIESRTRWMLNKIDRARAPLRVAIGADRAPRLEEDDVDVLL